MPITSYLSEAEQFDPETKRVMGVAFELALAALRLSDRADSVVGMVAQRVIELAKAGEGNADLLCEQALRSLGIEQLNTPMDGEAFRFRPVGPSGLRGSDSTTAHVLDASSASRRSA